MKALRILVVEDDALIAALLGEMLEGMGHNVCSIVADEDNAVAAAIRCCPEIMIVDVGLRDGDGVSAVDRISRGRSIPHMFVTADFVRVKALRPNAIVVQKPYREPDIFRAIERTMSVAALT